MFPPNGRDGRCERVFASTNYPGKFACPCDESLTAGFPKTHDPGCGLVSDLDLDSELLPPVAKRF